MENNYIELDWDLVEKIYVDKAKILKRIAYKRVHNIEVAEDIVQNTMESICKIVNKNNRIYNLDAWINTILKYRCIDVYRKNNSIQYFSNDVIENCLIEEEIDTIENINLFMALTIQKFLEFLDVVVKQ